MQFYTHLLTSHRGTLAKIWLACHWEKKLTKAQVFECNLEAAIQDIICPQFKIGLRTSGHLLFGVARIYARKAKYLLADCNEAVVKIRVAFRPDQLDLPDDMNEARLKSITLPEDFTDFDFALPNPVMLEDIMDNTLNQSRMEEITLKEDIPLVMADGFSVRSLVGDVGDGLELEGFGDDDMETTIMEFLMEDEQGSRNGLSDLYRLSNDVPQTPPPTAINHNDADADDVEMPMDEMSADETLIEASHGSPRPATPAPSVGDETILVENEAEFFALEPVAATPGRERKRARKKRSLIVDARKELSNGDMRRMLEESEDLLLETLDLVPPLRPPLEWKIGGAARSLLKHPTTVHPDLLEIFLRDTFPRKPGKKEPAVNESDSEPEKIREQHREEVNEAPVFPPEEPSVLQESAEQSRVSLPPITEELQEPEIFDLPPNDCNNNNVFSPPDPVSEDSLMVHASGAERESLTLSVTQTSQNNQADQNSEDVEEKKLTSRAKRLLKNLKSKDSRPSAMYNLQELSQGYNRTQVASMFYSLLVLQKQRAINLHQSAPYCDIIATPGPNFSF
ncbi:double-strand-break repair protein rad21-like protein 1 isoform X2 [Engraulis encrasicolus]|uniref:double-strand-break repair protein rad21-like protein 1 isoform X2 n=1 Tax=Engraulis encrasicolus TaxID=184585 RepID=UPI002FD26F3A